MSQMSLRPLMPQIHAQNRADNVCIPYYRFELFQNLTFDVRETSTAVPRMDPAANLPILHQCRNAAYSRAKMRRL